MLPVNAQREERGGQPSGRSCLSLVNRSVLAFSSFLRILQNSQGAVVPRRESASLLSATYTSSAEFLLPLFF